MALLVEKSVLVTGAAGFIGYHLSLKLLSEGYSVVGFDNMNPYYDVQLKEDRLAFLLKDEKFSFVKGDLQNMDELRSPFLTHHIGCVVNLAAQAGVRYSIENPKAYIDSNITGFMNILEVCKAFDIKDLFYASSSSVYGGNEKVPFAVEDRVDSPISIYAATKKSNELMAHVYSHLFDMNTTGLRFFTVYGPYGRPDMALFLFTKAIMSGEPIKIFNYGNMERDFTYVDDIVESIYRLMIKQSEQVQGQYKVYNIGNNNPVKLEAFIDQIELQVGIKAVREYLPLQLGDVPSTYADIDALIEDTGFTPQTRIEEGVARFVDWYKAYYHV